MKKFVALYLVAIYLMASVVFSIGHAYAENPWEFRQSRNGLLCVEYVKYNDYEWEFVVYSPFCNWSDVYLFGVCHELVDGYTEWYTFGDGFANFGEW